MRAGRRRIVAQEDQEPRIDAGALAQIHPLEHDAGVMQRLAQAAVIGLDIPAEGEAPVLLHDGAGRQHPGDQLAGLAVAAWAARAMTRISGLARLAVAHGIGGVRQLGGTRQGNDRFGGTGRLQRPERAAQQRRRHAARQAAPSLVGSIAARREPPRAALRPRHPLPPSGKMLAPDDATGAGGAQYGRLPQPAGGPAVAPNRLVPAQPGDTTSAGASATAASLVSSRKVKLACRYRVTVVSVWLE